MKKALILLVLFILPLVAYLFFASGINNFGVLPTLTNSVTNLPENPQAITLEKHISILGFLGSDIEHKKGNAFNLNQKIYKRFFEFKDFQFVMVMPKGTEDVVDEITKDLSVLVDVSQWHFVYLDPSEIQSIFESLKVEDHLDAHLATDRVYIIDKEMNLRGRDELDKEHPYQGYDATSVADLTNVMIDDVKILLAEYRMALKKNSGRN